MTCERWPEDLKADQHATFSSLGNVIGIIDPTPHRIFSSLHEDPTIAPTRLPSAYFATTVYASFIIPIYVVVTMG